MIKCAREMEREEACPKCAAPADRQFVPSRVYFNGAKVTHAEYNPGLGCVVKDKAHKEDILKRRGLVEVGNDFKSGDSMQTQFDKAREEKRTKSWEDV